MKLQILLIAGILIASPPHTRGRGLKFRYACML